MIRFLDGFDQLRSMDGQVMTDILNNSGYAITGTVKLAPARDNTQLALQIGDATADAVAVKRTFSSSATKVVLGFAYCAEKVRSDIATVKNLGTLGWNPTDGHLSFAGGTGTATILLNLWYYFEIVLDKTAGTVQLWVNNGKDIEVAMPNTAQFLALYETTWASDPADKKFLDDLYFLDSDPSAHTDRLGPLSIASRLPTSDVDQEWTPATGTDHYALVDNEPPKDTDFLQSNTSGATDTFLSNVGLPAGAQIIAVGVTVLNRKSDIDARQLGMVVGRKGQKQLEVVDKALTLTPKYSYAVFETAPDGSAWNDEKATSVPFGVVVRP